MHLLTDQTGLDIVLQIHVDTNDYLPRFMTELKNQRKTLQMRGFRKGEAPLSLLRKIIGAEKLVRILDETLNTTIANYMKEHQRNYVGNPISLSINPPIDPRVDQDYVFEVLLGEHGKIVNRLDYNNKIFTRYNIEVEEDDVEDTIKNLRLRYAKDPIEPTSDETLEADDVLAVTLLELDANGEIVSNGIQSDVGRFTLSQITDPAWNEKLSSLHIGDTIIVPIFDLFKAGRKEVAYSLLNIKDETNLDTLPTHYQMTIDRATRYVQPELDEDFFAQVYPYAEEVLDEQGFRDKVREELEIFWAERSETANESDLIDAMLAETTFEVPEKYLYELWRRDEKNEIVKEEPAYTAYFEQAKKQYEWQLIVSDLLKDSDFDPTQAEIEQEAILMMSEQLRQMGYNSFNAQWVNYAKGLLKDPKQVQQIQMRLAQRKAIEILRSDVSIQTANISVEEFEKLDKKA
ncbi:MAG: hypothetical protein JNM36_13195 [Chitinophagales bacterium]|jgi:trigger factor|nr:hypothetical protein [Chitinophagales bacterium]